jgi:hypothetical protein
MKKTAFLLLLLTYAGLGFAQDRTTKLGIRLAPAISTNGAESESSAGDAYSKSGSSVRLGGGLVADFFLTDNYAFSTGLWYTIKRSAFQRNLNNVADKSEYNLQYFQIPISLKLYTNEVALDTRIYFQLGGTLDIKLAERPLNKATNWLYIDSRTQDKKAYKPVDAGLLLGVGVETAMGENTSVFGGLTFNRGLVNVLTGVEDNGQELNDIVRSRNTVFSLELGLKF